MPVGYYGDEPRQVFVVERVHERQRVRGGALGRRAVEEEPNQRVTASYLQRHRNATKIETNRIGQRDRNGDPEQIAALRHSRPSPLVSVPVPFKYGFNFDWVAFVPIAVIFLVGWAALVMRRGRPGGEGAGTTPTA